MHVRIEASKGGAGHLPGNWEVTDDPCKDDNAERSIKSFQPAPIKQCDDQDSEENPRDKEEEPKQSCAAKSPREQRQKNREAGRDRCQHRGLPNDRPAGRPRRGELRPCLGPHANLPNRRCERGNENERGQSPENDSHGSAQLYSQEISSTAIYARPADCLFAPKRDAENACHNQGNAFKECGGSI